MERAIEKINEVLKNRKNIGYLEVWYENQLVGHFATEKTLRNEGIEMPNGMIFFENKYLPDMTEAIKNIEKAKRVVTRGDFYGDGFSRYLIEELRFYKE